MRSRNHNIWGLAIHRSTLHATKMPQIFQPSKPVRRRLLQFSGSQLRWVECMPQKSLDSLRRRRARDAGLLVVFVFIRSDEAVVSDEALVLVLFDLVLGSCLA